MNTNVFARPPQPPRTRVDKCACPRDGHPAHDPQPAKGAAA